MNLWTSTQKKFVELRQRNDSKNLRICELYPNLFDFTYRRFQYLALVCNLKNDVNVPTKRNKRKPRKRRILIGIQNLAMITDPDGPKTDQHCNELLANVASNIHSKIGIIVHRWKRHRKVYYGKGLDIPHKKGLFKVPGTCVTMICTRFAAKTHIKTLKTAFIITRKPNGHQNSCCLQPAVKQWIFQKNTHKLCKFFQEPPDFCSFFTNRSPACFMLRIF